MVPHVLAGLGRVHDPAAVVAAAAAGARCPASPSWNVDLIFGAVGESDRGLAATLDEIVALGPPHVSAYALTVERGHAAGRRSVAPSRSTTSRPTST